MDELASSKQRTHLGVESLFGFGNESRGGHVWAERYDRDLTDIFAIQDEITKEIVTALRLRLLPEEKKAIESRGTTNAEAYDLYLMARQYWASGNDGDAKRDQIIPRLCRSAIEADQNMAARGH